ncbi:MAG: HDOD domain-containing protein [Sulfurisoma sp.]|nr:HDOD domain-containing protein [Sulfurisoma sp.]
MPRSKTMLRVLHAERGDRLATRELADLAGVDPLLCLRLLRAAEGRRSRRLGRETSTPLGAVMQLGVAGFGSLLRDSPEAEAGQPGLAGCEARGVLAGRLARSWGAARGDVVADEIAMAALLAEAGELLLWTFAPELPQAALDALAADGAGDAAAAQRLACGFEFRDLTLACAALWELPVLVTQLIRGVDDARANLSRLCSDTARHLSRGPDDPELPFDLAAARRLIPNASLPWLAARLVGLDEERRAAIIHRAGEILASGTEAAPSMFTA